MSLSDHPAPDRPPHTEEPPQTAEARAERLWLLEGMARVNVAMYGSNDFEQVLHDVLGIVLELLGCDRAWLMRPCDPDAPAWTVIMERTRPEWPGALELKRPDLVQRDVATVMRALRDTAKPVGLGPGLERPVPPELGEAFHTRSQLAMAIYPKSGQAHAFGIHQCSHERVWTPNERRLFRAIGRRLADALTTLIVVRDQARSLEQLRASEERFRELAEGVRAMNERYARQAEALTALTRACTQQTASVRELKREIAEVTARTLGVDQASIWRLDRRGETLTLRAQHTTTPGTPAGIPMLRLTDCPVYFRAITGGDVVAVDDVLHDARTAGAPAAFLSSIGVTSMLDVPIHTAGRVVGVLSLKHVGPPRAWTTDEQSFAVAVANVVSLLLAEEERREMEQQLRHSQKMEAIGQLAGGVAHDFNNILAAILMHAEMAAEIGDAGARDDLTEIRDAAERAANLTRQLLLFSRRQVMQVRELDLNGIVTNLSRMLGRIIGEDVRLETRLSPAQLMTRADAGMLDQLLMNLSVNARDAMPDGGLLRIETGAQLVDDPASLAADVSPGRYVWLAVTDTGTGISKDVLPRIFEPFFTTKEPGKGTGLGLATVFGIVKQHRGWIDVSSEVGRGATFRVHLPACEAVAKKEAAAAPRAAPRGGQETILLVEDEAAVRSVVCTMLRRGGYRVLEASNGEDALALWQREGPSVALLLTDLVMPGGVGGQALARRLQSEKPDLKVIFTSGYSPDTAGRSIDLLPGERFLQKPFSAATLLEAVRGSLDG